MEEKRKAKRIPASITLEISKLFKQDEIVMDNLNETIEVINISKLGIGFISESIIPVGYYFDANINMGKKDTLHCVLHIVRSQPTKDNKTIYGCEFVGMPSVLQYVFHEYENNIMED